MAKNRGLTFSDLKNRSPEHLSATLTGCESPDGYAEPAADDQLSEIASTIPPADPSCVDLKHSVFPAQLLLEEVDLESTSEPAPHVGKPVLHMQPVHTGGPVARSPDALARPASNNMPLSEHDTQDLRWLLYLKAQGIGVLSAKSGCNTSDRPGNPPSGLRRTMIPIRCLILRYR